ncbi:MAG: hypothetical protein EXR72_18175 [Myxococcales bacterium]|nr:hypothetical protein [Myxococcales bacterium]
MRPSTALPRARHRVVAGDRAARRDRRGARRRRGRRPRRSRDRPPRGRLRRDHPWTDRALPPPRR